MKEQDERKEETVEALTDEEAIAMIGKRAAEIAKIPQIQMQLVEVAKKDGKDMAMRELYMLAISTLYGFDK